MLDQFEVSPTKPCYTKRRPDIGRCRRGHLEDLDLCIAGAVRARTNLEAGLVEKRLTALLALMWVKG
jgi:hypothetical protein